MGNFKPPQQVRKRLAHGLVHHDHIEVATTIFIFWMIQFTGWMLMMLYVQFFDQALGEKVLYVTQISHWALVEAAGTAALSSWALIQSKHNTRQIQQMQTESTLSTQEQIRIAAAGLEQKISELAKIPPGPSADELAQQILQALKNS